MNIFDEIRENTVLRASKLVEKIKKQYGNEDKKQEDKNRALYIQNLEAGAKEARIQINSSNYPHSQLWYNDLIRKLNNDLKNVNLDFNMDKEKQSRASAALAYCINMLERLRDRPQRVLDDLKRAVK